MSKIVAIDNFDRDYIPERVIEEGLTEADAKRKVLERNGVMSDREEWFWVVRRDDQPTRTLETMYG